MIENIISSLIVASITGLTFLAYAHPETYKFVHRPIEVIWFFASTAALFYYIGYTNALSYVEDAYPQALKNRPNFDLILLASFGAYLYLMLLRHGITRLKSTENKLSGKK